MLGVGVWMPTNSMGTTRFRKGKSFTTRKMGASKCSNIFAQSQPQRRAADVVSEPRVDVEEAIFYTHVRFCRCGNDTQAERSRVASVPVLQGNRKVHSGHLPSVGTAEIPERVRPNWGKASGIHFRRGSCSQVPWQDLPQGLPGSRRPCRPCHPCQSRPPPPPPIAFAAATARRQ